MCLPSRCLAMSYSGFQASCHNSNMVAKEMFMCDGRNWCSICNLTYEVSMVPDYNDMHYNYNYCVVNRTWNILSYGTIKCSAYPLQKLYHVLVSWYNIESFSVWTKEATVLQRFSCRNWVAFQNGEPVRKCHFFVQAYHITFCKCEKGIINHNVESHGIFA